MTHDELVESQIDEAIEAKHKEIIDLGWHNAGGETARKIDMAREACLAQGHKPTDHDHSFYKTGADHWVYCEHCAYVYHYDSSD